MPIPEGFVLDDKKDAARIQVPKGFVIDSDGAVQEQHTSALDRVKDVGISALKGSIGIGESVLGLADIVTGGRAGQLAEEVGYKPGEAKKILDTYYSPAQQEANAEVAAAKGFVPTVKAMVQNPSTILHTGIESAPSMLGGAGVARGGMALTGKYAPKAIAALGKSAPVVAGAIGEGAMSAGSTAEQIRQESPTGTITPTQSLVAADSGMLTALFGAVSGKVASKLGIADIDSFMASGAPTQAKVNVAKALVGGAVTEGVLEELPQSAQEKMAYNIATGRPLMEGVPEQAGSGMVTGGVMGVGGNAVNHVASRAPQPTPQPVPSGPLSKAVAQSQGMSPAEPVPTAADLVAERRAAKQQGMAPQQATIKRVLNGNGGYEVRKGPGAGAEAAPVEAPPVAETQPTPAPTVYAPEPVRTFAPGTQTAMDNDHSQPLIWSIDKKTGNYNYFHSDEIAMGKAEVGDRTPQEHLPYVERAMQSVKVQANMADPVLAEQMARGREVAAMPSRAAAPVKTLREIIAERRALHETANEGGQDDRQYAQGTEGDAYGEGDAQGDAAAVVPPAGFTVDAEDEGQVTEPTSIPQGMTRHEYNAWRIKELQRLNPQLRNTLTYEIMPEGETDNAELPGANLQGGARGSVVRVKDSAPVGTGSHETRHLIDRLLGGNQVTAYIGDLAKQGRLDALKNYLKSFMKNTNNISNGRTTTDEETAQVALDAYYRDKEGLRAVSPDLVEFLDLMGADKYAHLNKTHEEYSATRSINQQHPPSRAAAPVQTISQLIAERRALKRTDAPVSRAAAPVQSIGELVAERRGLKPQQKVAEKSALPSKDDLYGNTVTVYHGSPNADIEYMDGSRGTRRQSFFPTKEQAAGWVGAKHVYAVDINVGDLWDYRDPVDVKALAQHIFKTDPRGDSYGEILSQVSKGNAAIIERGGSEWLKDNYSTYTTNEQGSDAIHQFKGGQKARLIPSDRAADSVPTAPSRAASPAMSISELVAERRGLHKGVEKRGEVQAEQPTVYYRGKTGETAGYRSGGATWYTPDKEYAAEYGDVTEHQLSPQKTYRLDTPESYSIFTDDPAQQKNLAEMGISHFPPEVVQKLQDAGYDSVSVGKEAGVPDGYKKGDSLVMLPEPSSPSPAQEAAAKGAQKVNPSRMTTLRALRDEISQGDAGFKTFNEGEYGGDYEVGAAPSTFPDYFRNKGYKKKDTLALIDKAIAGKKLTEKQQDILDDLMEGKRRETVNQLISYRRERFEERARELSEVKPKEVSVALDEIFATILMEEYAELEKAIQEAQDEVQRAIEDAAQGEAETPSATKPAERAEDSGRRSEQTDDAGGWQQEVAVEATRKNPTIGQVQKQGGKRVDTSSLMDSFTPDPPSLFDKPKYALKTDTIDVDGVERPAVNSNGDPIAKTEEATRNFWRWFGNSKVVDSQGRPKVVYHGSPDVRGILKGGFERRLGGRDSFFATDSYAMADSYADDRRAWDYQNAEPYTIAMYLKLENPMVVDAAGANWKDTEKHLSEAAIKGHDGIIIKNSVDFYNNEKKSKPATVYSFFTPNAAKSAMTGKMLSRVDRVTLAEDAGNNGDFDPNNPDIRHSLNHNPATLTRERVAASFPNQSIREEVAPLDPVAAQLRESFGLSSLQPGQMNLTPELAQPFKGSVFHGTDGEAALRILRAGEISPNVSNLDKLGESTISLSRMPAGAASYGNVVYRIKDRGNYRSGKDANKGDWQDGIEIRDDNPVPLSEIEKVYVMLGSKESLSTTIKDTTNYNRKTGNYEQLGTYADLVNGYRQAGVAVEVVGPDAKEEKVFIVTTPSGVSIKISKVGAIEFDRAAAEAAYGRPILPHEKPVAEFRPLPEGAIINLTEQGVGELDHEVLHLAMATALTPRQIKVILDRYGNEEKAAAEYQRLRDEGAFDRKQGHMFLRRIYDFFRSLRQLISPTAEGIMRDVASGKVWNKAHEGRGGARYAAAWHGSPYDFDKFKKSAIGTGEGAQAYGYGLYFAGAKEVAEWYRKGLSTKEFINLARDSYDEFDDPTDAVSELRNHPKLNEAQRELIDALEADDWLGFDYPHQAISAALNHPNRYELSDDTKAALAKQGRLYQVELAPKDEELLDWDKSLSEQSEVVQDALEAAGLWSNDPSDTGMTAYKGLTFQHGSDVAASEYLHSLGIRGIKYLDGSTRNNTRWVAKHPQGGVNDFASEKDARAFVAKNPEYELIPPKQNHNIVIFDDADVEITAKYSLRSAFNSANPRALHSALTNHPKVQAAIGSVFNNGRNITPWMRTVGTMYHMAQKLDAAGKPQFLAVFNKGQDFLNDVSTFAVTAEGMAPDIFPKLGTGKGLFHHLKKADAQAIASPLFDGTLYGGADPTHGKVFTDLELRQLYKLTDHQIELYKQARAATDQSLDDMARSLIAKNAKQAQFVAFDRDMSLADMAKDVADQIQNRIEDMKAELETLPEKEQKRQQAAIDLHESLKKNVEKIAYKTDLLKKRGYFPLMRFGEYTVTMKNAQGDVEFFSLHESAYKARLMADSLAKQYPQNTVTQAVMAKEKFKLYAGMNLEALQLFAEHLDKEDTEAYQEYLKNAMNNRSAMKRLIHRKGTAGYSEDAVRTLASFVVSNARHASTQYNLHDMHKLVADIPSDTQGDVQDQAIKLYEYLTKPAEEAAKLRGYLFFHYLGGSLASGIVNMTQPIMMTAPYLAQKTSAKNVVKYLTAASKNSFTDPAKMKGEIGTALRRAEAEGVTAPQEIYQMTAVASNKLLASNPVWNTALKGWGGFFAAAEAFNRRITFLAAYQIARDNGKTQDTAYREAIDAIRATQGIYNKGNKPNWGRGTIGATLFTFKQFSVMYLELFNRLPLKQKMIMAGTLMLMAGLQGMPFAEDAEDIVDTIGQWAGFATNSKMWLNDFARRSLGERGGNFLLRGVSSVLPLDIQGRLGMQNLIPGTSVLKQSETNRGRDVQEFFGPMGGLVNSMGDAISLFAIGQVDRGILASLPRALQNLAQGAEMMATGAGHDKYGRKTVEVTKGEAAIKMTGFNPTKIAEESQVKTANMQDINLLRVKKNAIAQQWAYGIANKDKGEIAEAKAALRDWNLKNPELKLNQMQVLKSAQQRAKTMKMSAKDRFIKSVPKEQRRRIIDELG